MTPGAVGHDGPEDHAALGKGCCQKPRAFQSASSELLPHGLELGLVHAAHLVAHESTPHDTRRPAHICETSRYRAATFICDALETDWLDSNSGIRAPAMYLRCRD